MPAKSKAERKLWGMADAIKEGKLSPNYSPAAAKMAKQPSSVIDEFAKTKETGLPMHTVGGLKRMRLNRKR
jgi:hypothetical protein